jgi:hypothetical protein
MTTTTNAAAQETIAMGKVAEEINGIADVLSEIGDMRDATTISDEYMSLWDKVWWARHQDWIGRVGSDVEMLMANQLKIYRQADENAKRIEQEYGRATLIDESYDLELLIGRMSALAWVLGDDWHIASDM